MNKYTRIVEHEIAMVKGYIERHKGVGAYHDRCEVWRHQLTAYERILDLLAAETDRIEAVWAE
jgi:hypothetical protein